MPALYCLYRRKNRGVLYEKRWKTRGSACCLHRCSSQAERRLHSRTSFAENVEIESPAACLMELTTGKILYEKEADTRRSPASVTKIMTTLLIMEAIKSRKITLQDEVVTSALMPNPWAARRYLEEGEKQIWLIHFAQMYSSGIQERCFRCHGRIHRRKRKAFVQK